MASGRERALVAVGFIRKAVGLAGHCGVSAPGNTLEALRVPCSVFIGPDEANAQPINLVEVQRFPAGLRCLFEGCADRTGAERLEGSVLFIALEDLPPLPAGRFYHFQVMGMPVFMEGSEEVWGTVVGVHNYPTVDALETRRVSGATVLIPLTPDGATVVDLEKGAIRIRGATFEEILE